MHGRLPQHQAHGSRTRFGGRASRHLQPALPPAASKAPSRPRLMAQQTYSMVQGLFVHAAVSNGQSNTADSTEELHSLGVPLRPYSNTEALAAVSSKSFTCTMCGKCCTMAEDAEVWVSDAEVFAMANYLNITTAAFTSLYCQPYEKLPGWKLLLNKQQQQQQQHQSAHGPATAANIAGQPGGAVCVFLDENTKGCTVYPVRPIQCSTYPWWPELMPDKNWLLEKDYMCEGFNHPDAEPLDRWHAAQQLQKATQHTMALEAAKPVGWDAVQQLYGGDQEQAPS